MGRLLASREQRALIVCDIWLEFAGWTVGTGPTCRREHSLHSPGKPVQNCSNRVLKNPARDA